MIGHQSRKDISLSHLMAVSRWLLINVFPKEAKEAKEAKKAKSLLKALSGSPAHQFT
jgi:hypothetical protein